jgi:cell division protein FtsQ
VDRDPAEARRQAGRAVMLAFPTVAALAALAVGVLAAWKLGVEGNAFRIREVRFEGLERVAAQELLELSPIRPGDHLLSADPATLEAALARHPWIASVEARRVFPPALVVKVVERHAAALVDLGNLYLVDARGRVFKRARPGDGLDLPVVTGLGRDEYVNRREELESLLAGAVALAERWEEAGRAPLSEVHLGADREVTVYAGDEGMEVRLGQGDLAAKLARLDRVLAGLERTGQKAQVIHLDNRRRPDWVAVRLRGRRGWRAEGQPDEAAPERAGGPGGHSPTAPPRHDGERPRGR